MNSSLASGGKGEKAEFEERLNMENVRCIVSAHSLVTLHHTVTRKTVLYCVRSMKARPNLQPPFLHVSAFSVMLKLCSLCPVAFCRNNILGAASPSSTHA